LRLAGEQCRGTSGGGGGTGIGGASGTGFVRLPGPGDGFGMLTTHGRPGVPCLSGRPRRAVPCLSWLCGGRNAGLGLPHWSCAPHRHLGWPTLRSRMNGKWRFGLIMVHSDERARALVGPGLCRSPRGHRERGTRPAVSRFKTTAHLLRVSAETFGAIAGMILRCPGTCSRRYVRRLRPRTAG
jgi:hypothetical protein